MLLYPSTRLTHVYGCTQWPWLDRLQFMRPGSFVGLKAVVNCATAPAAQAASTAAARRGRRAWIIIGGPCALVISKGMALLGVVICLCRATVGTRCLYWGVQLLLNHFRGPY